MNRLLLYTGVMLSLATNVALLHSRLSPSASSPAVTRPVPQTETRSTKVADPTSVDRSAIAAAWADRQPDNLRQLGERLRAAGLAERMVRAMIGTEIDASFRDRENALRPPGKKPAFWQRDETVLPFKTKLALLDLAREKRKLRDEALGSDPDATAGQDSAGYDHLPPEKRERARHISEDYAVMLESMRTEVGVLPLPTDVENIRRIEAERRRDLAEFLSPEELEEDERRGHPFAKRVRAQTQFFDATPNEFNDIFAAEVAAMAANSTLPGIGPSSAEERQTFEVEKNRLQEKVKATLGEARYADYLRARNDDFQVLADLAIRNGRSIDAAKQVFVVRDFASTESNRIHADTTLDVEQKRATLKTLADNTRAQIVDVLGSAATEAYSGPPRHWLNLVEQGFAVTFGENGGSSARPLGGVRPSVK